MKKIKNHVILFVCAAGILTACQKAANTVPQTQQNVALQQNTASDARQSSTNFNAANFAKGNVIDNPYYPLKVGAIYHYVQVFQEGNHSAIENIQIYVTSDVKRILKTDCTVVHDVVNLRGQLLEDTYDWFAQDVSGNVWYMGENTKKLIGGVWVTTGSWEAGVDGALPGIIMLAHPEEHIGESYRQEYRKDSAEDMAKVIAVNTTTTIQLGTFSNCVVTEETSRLDPGVKENKYYVPGIGNISTILNVGGKEHEELVGFTK